MNEYKYWSLLHLLFLLSVVVPVVNVVVILPYIIFPCKYSETEQR